MKKLFIDFETYSDVPVSLGPRAYVAGRDFRPMILAYAVDNGPVKVITDFSKMHKDIVDMLCMGGLWIAHNAPFDREVFLKTYRVEIEDMYDTAAMCRYLSVPASLDGASEFFGLGQKKESGKGFINRLNKGGTLTPAEWKDFAKYAKQDVELLRKLYKIVSTVQMDEFTQRVHRLHEEQNASGIRVDQKTAQKLLKQILREKETTAKEAVKKFGTYGKDRKPVASSADQVKKYLASKGAPVHSIAEKDLEDFLAIERKKLPKDCQTLVGFYREIQSRGADKLSLIVDNGLTRIYDSALFHGAHTGRPTGGGVNLLNVKRYSKGDDEKPFASALSRIVKEATPGERVKRMSSLLWASLLPEKGDVLVRSDLSAVEPRVGAWLRDDVQTMQIYKEADQGTGKDEYTIFGEAMNFPKEISRDLSKIVILAACYGMGAERLRAQCRSWGMPDPGEQEAAKILEGYHRKNPSVRRTWFSLVKSAVLAIGSTHGIDHAEKVAFKRLQLGGKGFLAVTLPSGRVKHYADVRLESVGEKGWQSFSYIDPLKKFRTVARAAGLYENLVQAIAVDISFEKALEIQKLGSVKLIIHDEINVSAKKSKVAAIKKTMVAPVPWLPGMPVNSKTTVCTTFHKGDRVK